MARKVIIVLFALLLLALIVRISLGSSRTPGGETPSVALGEHLVTVLACNDCHTPFKLGPEGPEPDMSRMLSGHPQDLVMPEAPKLGEGPWLWVGAATNTAYAGPWGVSYAFNLTPHETTGLGIWTEQMFVDAIRTGRHMGQSRPIQPPMPWPMYRNLKDHELRSIYAYLRTVPPIDNRVPEWQPPAPAEDDWVADADPRVEASVKR